MTEIVITFSQLHVTFSPLHPGSLDKALSEQRLMWGTCWSAGGFDQSEAVIGELVGQEVNPHTNNPKKQIRYDWIKLQFHERH